MNRQKLQLTFVNSADEAPRVAKKVERFLNERYVNDSLTNKLLLCVDELVTNIIGHAYNDKQEHAVSLECTVNEEHIILELRDDGVPFDPTKQTRANTKQKLEERSIGGLGIHLVMNLMDHVEYIREGDFNVLKATKSIQQ